MLIRILKMQSSKKKYSAPIRKYVNRTEYRENTQGEAESRQKEKCWNLKRANQIHCSKCEMSHIMKHLKTGYLGI